MHPLQNQIPEEETIANTGDTWARSHEIMVPFAGPPGTYLRVSYANLLNNNELLDDLRGKIVIVGMTAAGLQQGFLTPASLAQRHCRMACWCGYAA